MSVDGRSLSLTCQLTADLLCVTRLMKDTGIVTELCKVGSKFTGLPALLYLLTATYKDRINRDLTLLCID